MAENIEKTSSTMLYERNDRLVIQAFRQGEFDYLEGVGGCRKRTSSVPSRTRRCWINRRPPIRLRAASMMFPCGYILRATFPCVFGDFFLYAGLKVVSGKERESPILRHLVEQFVEFHGKGIMKKLILDRGFLDGPAIGRCNKELGIHAPIPARRSWISVWM